MGGFLVCRKYLLGLIRHWLDELVRSEQEKEPTNTWKEKMKDSGEPPC